MFKFLLYFKILLKNIIYPPPKYYYSSCGEDFLLSKIFFNGYAGLSVEKGFYADIGAHHPTIASNTKYFYDRGWRGINVEANPGALQAFNRERPRDINLNYAVSLSESEMDFYLFGDENSELYGSSSTISADFKTQIEKSQNVRAKSIKVLSRKMETIFDMYLDNGQTIDFLSLDIEGEELGALRSNNWEKYRPLILVVEILPQAGGGYV